jgi:hypothetical protein
VPFDPLTMEPAMWLRFQDLSTLFQTDDESTPITADGQTIGRVNDKSGNDRDWTQSTEAIRPIYKTGIVNGQSVARFDGTQYIFGPNFNGVFDAAEVFVILRIVADPPAGVGEAGLWLLGVDNTAFFPFVDGVIYDNFGTTERKATVNPTPSLESWRLYNVVSTSGEWTSFLDGEQLFTTATNTVSFIDLASELGSSNAGGANLNGDLAELIMFDRKLDDDEKGLLKGYFADRYGLDIDGATFPPDLEFVGNDSGGGSGHGQRERQARPYWWHSYFAQWLDELEEEERKLREKRAKARAEEAAKREAAALIRVGQQRQLMQMQAEYERLQREANAVDVSRAVKGVRDAGEAERTALQERAGVALQRVEARKQQAQAELEAEELRKLRQIARSPHRRFEQRFEAALKAARRQGWRAKLN